MTAMETATFAAEMLLPVQLSTRAKKARAREVLSVVGLSHCENTMVGDFLYVHMNSNT
jgi:ABC-type multidrug transport system ATPase subunit